MENRKRVPSATAFIRRGTWDEDQARQVLGELAASGESVTAFARRRGLVPQRLWWWKKRLGMHRAPGGGPARPSALAPTFIPVTVRPAEQKAPAASFELGGGLHVQLRALDATSAAWVAQVVRALGEAP